MLVAHQIQILFKPFVFGKEILRLVFETPVTRVKSLVLIVQAFVLFVQFIEPLLFPAEVIAELIDVLFQVVNLLSHPI